MHIYSVNDPEFKSYGNVWDDVPSELTLLVLEALSATPIPEGSKYVASAPELESVKGADKLGFLMFGGRSSLSPKGKRRGRNACCVPAQMLSRLGRSGSPAPCAQAPRTPASPSLSRAA